MIPENRSVKIWQVICILIAAVFGLYFAAMTVTQAVSLWSRISLALPLLLFTGLAALGAWRMNRSALGWPALYRRLLWVLGALALVWSQFTFVFSIYGEYGWDVAYCIEVGSQLTDLGEGVHYLTVYPNNMATALLYGNVFWWCMDAGIADYMIPLVLLNIFLADLAVCGGALLARRTLGRGGMGAYLVLAVPLLLFSPWLAVPYTDVLSIFAPVLILFLWDRARQASLPAALGWWCLIGLIAGLGYIFKPTAVIALIAVGLMGFFLLKKNWRSWTAHLGGLALAAALVIALSQGLYLYCYSLAPMELNHETIEANSVPMSHFFMMGLNEKEGRYGAWNGDDVALTESIPGRSAKEEANLRVARERIEAMGLGGYLDFLGKKSSFTWNDGTFYYGGEGNFYQQLTNESPQAQAVQALIIPGGASNPLYTAWADGVWLVMLALMVLGAFGPNQSPALWAVRLTLLGLALFQLLFETRSRYLVNHLPVITLAAASGFEMLRSRLRRG